MVERSGAAPRPRPAGDSLSLPQARRIALAAQGFTDPRPAGAVTMRHLRRVAARTNLFQIDSVNVLMRAHYLPLFSRLGPYPTGLLDRAAYRAPRELFEYWGHEACLVPVRLQPALRWRMDRAREHAWGWMRTIAAQRPDLVAWVLDEVRERGPLTAAEIRDDGPRRTDQWGWNWSDVKSALEWLFWTGEVSTARRNGAFARVYDVTERILPADVLALPTPVPADAVRQLVALSAAALGVATETELRDYFRLPVAGFATAVAELVEANVLRPVTVAGVRQRTYLHAEAKIPRRVQACTLISPFDPLIWERDRAERLFGFRYRIGIYTRPAEREHGYYPLPFLLGDALAARVDLKADRKAGTLLVPGAWIEAGHDRAAVAEALASALRDLAEWLDLGDIAPPAQGDLAGTLAAALASQCGVTV